MNRSLAPLLNVQYSSQSTRLTLPARDELVGILLDTVTKSFPAGFNLALVDAEHVLLRAWGGHACAVGDVVRTSKKTLYDLASLTKVVVTTTIALQLIEQGQFSLEDPLRTWLPDYPRDDTTLFHLLTHTSGLIAHWPFYQDLKGRRAIEEAVYEKAADSPPAGQVLYSDLNFMLLGWAIEARTGQPLDHLFAERVASPLGLKHSFFRPSHGQRHRTAATELDGDQRLESGLVWGEVHDGNAWALGGVSGHAGLFASTRDVVRFVQSLLDPQRHSILRLETINHMTTSLVGVSPTGRGLGWCVNQPAWGDWPDGTFWHTGFTGTSILVSPSLGVAVVLLTNAIHPQRQLDRQAQFRIDIHNAIARCLP